LKKKDERNFFYKLKKLKKEKSKIKNYFRKIRAKKGHNKTGHAKVVAPKGRASEIYSVCRFLKATIPQKGFG